MGVLWSGLGIVVMKCLGSVKLCQTMLFIKPKLACNAYSQCCFVLLVERGFEECICAYLYITSGAM